MENVASYMGHKGYTIYKKNLDIEEQELIRKELTVSPHVPKNSLQKPKRFPVYRESPKKFYLPRYYGFKHYGEPEKNKLNDYIKINLKFKGELRDKQKPVVEKYLNHAEKHGGGLLALHTGFGKTILALNIISKLNVKTLIVVHKEFLLRQWIERIEQFLPDAHVGRIQAQVIDVENKDIVICMLQSLSMKEYPSNLFNEYGLTIVDECHHISSEVFSRALFKVVSKYMLGLSATVKRKDGLTYVIKMFLGELVCKIERKGEDKVTVKAIEYKTNDEQFNAVALDFRGRVKYSTMIKKICEYNQRSELILRVISDIIKNDTEKKAQIMVLAHNKSILKYLHDAIKERNIESVGYYVGGMKEKDLKISEKKRIIIATYAMAEEGLDIKTLTTLVLATPKVDVTQAVGRILRMKHENAEVYDIVDSHAMFQRHWGKRRVFYKKQQFKILMTDNKRYIKDDWDCVYDKKNNILRKKKKKSTQNNNQSTLIIKVNTESNALLSGKCMIDF
jgi:superfamily II DNA or RNA helicase